MPRDGSEIPGRRRNKSESDTSEWPPLLAAFHEYRSSHALNDESDIEREEEEDVLVMLTYHDESSED